MEYFTKELAQELLRQRKDLIVELSSLNENLPNYSNKIIELNNQILQIDNNV
ncbi:MAG: hypothetical protein GY739_11840, partial [Mesoflavibacter sp.]|nr:hypothetical protein [Mesoflavibacter sp.]